MQSLSINLLHKSFKYKTKNKKDVQLFVSDPQT
jgi:hypothetical protein